MNSVNRFVWSVESAVERTQPIRGAADDTPYPTPLDRTSCTDQYTEAGGNQGVSGSGDGASAGAGDGAEHGSEPIALPWLHMREPGAHPRTPRRARQHVDGTADRDRAAGRTQPAVGTRTGTGTRTGIGIGSEVAPSPIGETAAREVLARADELNTHLDACQLPTSECATCADEVDGAREDFWRERVPAAEAVIEQAASAALVAPDRPGEPHQGGAADSVGDDASSSDGRRGRAVEAAHDAVARLRAQAEQHWAGSGAEDGLDSERVDEHGGERRCDGGVQR